LRLIHPSCSGDQHEAEWVENSLDLQCPLSRGRGLSSFGSSPRQRTKSW
jgi:hypothetical protein